MTNLRKGEKRIIRIKNPQLQKFRLAMRELLKAAYSSEWWRLRDLSDSVEIDNPDLRREEEFKIERQIEELDRARRKAPIGCRICGRQNLDLIYNPYNSQWYCEGCYTFNQKYYKKNPHPYEADWKKLYP